MRYGESDLGLAAVLPTSGSADHGAAGDGCAGSAERIQLHVLGCLRFILLQAARQPGTCC